MAAKARVWTVTTHDGTVHTFDTEDKAVALAMLMAWSDRTTTITTPEGGAYLVIRRDPQITIQAVRAL